MKNIKLFTALFVGSMTVYPSYLLANENTKQWVNSIKLSPSVVIRKDSVAISLSRDSLYGELSSNFDDKYGIGAAYNKNGVVVWGSVSRAKEWMQYGLGAGYVWDINENIYAGAFAKGTKFEANNRFADANSVKARAFLWTDITNNFSIEWWAEYTNTKSVWYNRESNTSPYVWATYKADNGWSARAYWNDNEAWFTLSIPFGDNNATQKSKTQFAQHNMAQVIADSSWNGDIVRAEKAPEVKDPEVVPPTVSSPTINAIWTQNINDNWGFVNVAVTTVAWTDINPWATYSIVSDSTWWKLTIDSNTWVLTWFWDINPSQNYSITIKVTNTDGWVDTDTFTLNVTDNL